jgi:hypothetical protein
MTAERDELWCLLEVDNQTAAIVRLRGLLERDKQNPYRDPHPTIKEIPMPEDISIKPKPENTGKPDKKGTFIIGAIVAVVIGVVAIAWHQGMF